MPTRRYVTQDESQNKLNTRDLYEDKMNVRYEMYDYTGNNWSHRNSNRSFKNIRSHTSKTFIRFSTKNIFTWKIAHNTESIAVRLSGGFQLWFKSRKKSVVVVVVGGGGGGNINSSSGGEGGRSGGGMDVVVVAAGVVVVVVILVVLVVVVRWW